MNKAERRFLALALFFLALGWASRLGALDVDNSLQALLPTDAALAETSGFAEVAPRDSQKVVAVSGRRQPASKRAASSSGKKAMAKGLPINKAGLAELQKISGVGPALAQRIFDYRGAHGPFRSAQDLDKVPGIGEKKLQSICAQVIFD